MKTITKIQARKRNLLIKLTKLCIEREGLLNGGFTLKEISSILYFRKSDIKNYLDEMFDEDGEKYYINSDTLEEVNKYIGNHEGVDGKEESKETYLKKFKSFRDEYRKNIHSFDFSSKYRELQSELKPYIEALHWYILPEYDEQMIVNSNIIPEENINEYYNHYHALEDLYEALSGNIVPIDSLKGDLNMNKRLKFKVFSRRWGHHDTYNIERRIEGWHVSHISINGMSSKDGTDSLINNLNHDSIQFPEDGVKYALETLWNMADETEMTVEELQTKLQQIADWISEVEKTIGEYQPGWVNYY